MSLNTTSRPDSLGTFMRAFASNPFRARGTLPVSAMLLLRVRLLLRPDLGFSLRSAIIKMVPMPATPLTAAAAGEIVRPEEVGGIGERVKPKTVVEIGSLAGRSAQRPS